MHVPTPRLSPVVGRQREQASLHEGLVAAFGGHGRLVLISGEAGIGKSTFANAVLGSAEEQGAAIAVGRCYEAGGAPPFAPWHELLAELPDLAPDRPPLPPPFGTGAPAQTAYQLMATVANCLRALAAARPLVLLLEDLHWADYDTLELLDVVTRPLSRLPLLFLATYRADAVQRSQPLFDVLPLLRRDRPAMNLSLGGLRVADGTRLVEEHYGRCSPALAAYLHARSEGHPLFLIELLRDLIERQLLPRDNEGQLLPPTHAVQAPALLQQLIAHRIARLGAEEETLLTVAAVVGEEWDLDVVEAVVEWEEEPLLRALEAALRADVIVPTDEGERYRFRHGLIREVLYTQQLVRRRMRLHLRVGAVLEQSAGARRGREAALAHHFAAAEDWEKAVHYGIASGDAARERLAEHGALVAYQQALAALEQASVATAQEVLVSLHERLGRTHIVLGEPAAAEAAFASMLEAARQTEDRPGEGRALVWISYVRRRQYQPAGSQSAGEASLRVAEEIGEPRLLALAHWNLGHLHEIEGDLLRSAFHAGEAERLARAAADSDTLSRGLQVQAILAIWQGRYRDAERLASEALDLARAGHDGLAFVSAHWRLGLALGEQGHYAAARRMLLDGVDHAETLGERYYLSKLLNTVGWLYHELGDPDSARQWNRRALQTVRQSHAERVSEAERYTLLNLAANELAAGNVDVAADHLRDFEPLLEQHVYGRIRYHNHYQLLSAEVALAQGDPAAALRAANEASQLANEHRMLKNRARCHLLAGRALLAQGRPREAADELQEGVTLADELAHGSLPWQGRLWLGHALWAMRRDATDVYREAMRHVERVARGLDDDDLRATFLASPRVCELRDALAAAEEEGQPDRPAGLTARELDVLRLLAQHQTDKEIADALFLSPRTVGTHVANILIKLTVANRREAAACAVGLGLG